PPHARWRGRRRGKSSGLAAAAKHPVSPSPVLCRRGKKHQSKQCTSCGVSHSCRARDKVAILSSVYIHASQSLSLPRLRYSDEHKLKAGFPLSFFFKKSVD